MPFPSRYRFFPRERIEPQDELRVLSEDFAAGSSVMWREEAICDAIASRTIISLVYHDEQRELEPHILGFNADGGLVLNGWQISGDRGWRNFHLSKVTELELTDKSFWRPRPDYRRDDATFADVICQL